MLLDRATSFPRQVHMYLYSTINVIKYVYGGKVLYEDVTMWRILYCTYFTVYVILGNNLRTDTVCNLMEVPCRDVTIENTLCTIC